MLLLRLMKLLVICLSHQRSFRSFGTTQSASLTYSYYKTRSCGDGMWKETKYLKPFHHILHFAYCHGFLFRGSQMVVPKAKMLSSIQESYQGIFKSKQLAQSSRFVPSEWTTVTYSSLLIF